MTRHLRALALVCVAAGCASTARAQTPAPATAAAGEDPSATARFRFGVLRFTPMLLVNSVGVDSNVFNTVQDPKQDTTAAVGPGASLWLKTGPALLSGKLGAQYLYFKTYANQRAWNSTDALKWELTTGRVRPYVSGMYANTKNRPGYEVDSRIRQTVTQWDAGAEVRLSGRTALVLGGGQESTQFDAHSDFSGFDIAAALNRRTDTEHVQLRDQLTPLTTWVLNADTIQDRFDADRTRNADSVRVNTGFELRPAALISGSVLIGFRRLNILSDTAPDYNGLAVAADAMMRFGPNRLHVAENRDTTFSYNTATPFYAQTATTAELTHRIGRAWDVVLKGAFVNLAYHGGTQSGSDRVQQVGTGGGYLIGRTFRLGVDVDYYKRSTFNTTSQAYNGLRAGLSISYGMPQ